jgi:hypothetical protein
MDRLIGEKVLYDQLLKRVVRKDCGVNVQSYLRRLIAAARHA